MTLEISFSREITLFSDIETNDVDSLKSIQEKFIPEYLESLEFDVSKFRVMSKITEVIDKNDTIFKPKKNQMKWNVKRRNQIDSVNSL